MKAENIIIVYLLLLSLFYGCSENSLSNIKLKNKCNPERSTEEVIIPFSHSFRQFDYNCKHEDGYVSFYARYKDDENRILETTLSFPEKDDDLLRNEKINSWLSMEHKIYRTNTYIIEKSIILEPIKTLNSTYAVDNFDVDTITIVTTTSQFREDGSLVSCELSHTFKKEDDFDRKLIELGDIYSKLRIK